MPVVVEVEPKVAQVGEQVRQGEETAATVLLDKPLPLTPVQAEAVLVRRPQVATARPASSSSATRLRHKETA